MLKKLFATTLLASSLLVAQQASAADYQIDKEGQHAFINFKISHLGYSWLYGTFKDFDGNFSYDPAQPEASQVQVKIKTASIDSNHAERDKHLRAADFLNTSKHPEAHFVSTQVLETGEGTADITGDLTLNGVTQPVTIKAQFIGAGDDPWGGYRAGFEGTTELKLADFGIKAQLGPAAETVYLTLSVEGVRQ
ncbi:YceI family protein [Thiopseudomonas alkaliphila]|uniref:YceI family protein n=1 Tax=Thiopseudomonas alkaliphila TaxID=1697053 RepID=UPI002577AC1C|nr:YceI family protein [Thiopseudomonas alkaliphila]MDM1716600.1 YceI family protein [Thiopseudomonas alkaliphila]